MNKSTSGFTLVELLIVIVVIAILAAISIVVYTGIQQRANNTAIINAASSTIRLVSAYISAEGEYPYSLNGIGRACVTTDSGCRENTIDRPANETFDTNIASMGQPPRSIPTTGDTHYGIWLLYWSGSPAEGPLMMNYYLNGTNQQCGVGNVLASSGSSLSSTGYTNGNRDNSGKTHCMVYIPGPAHSS